MDLEIDLFGQILAVRERLFDLLLERQRLDAGARRRRRLVGAVADQRRRGSGGEKLVAAQLQQLAVVRRGVHRVLIAWFDRCRKRRVNRPGMYDTSDIRKGLKVLMDGNPYTVIEFQFVKPGKGAAFTRTKFKNLLTGAVFERNIRSGEKLEPANVESRDMQFLYKEGNDLVLMDQTNY